jgi:peptidoglycan/xylan/chitin deacetylase (PgdA/CDA1 family)
MIAVLAPPEDHDVVREFFQLFKTPWEFYRAGQRYPVVLCAGENQFNGPADLVILYSSARVAFDDENKISTGSRKSSPLIAVFGKYRLPLYNASLALEPSGQCLLQDEKSSNRIAQVDQSQGKSVARIGYDLFAEVRTLVTVGQPVENAALPALDLHIALLRNLIVDAGVPLVEIPPVPEGYSFIACLTHDVDHPFLTKHEWDHTTLGFFYRATAGSLVNFFRGRLSLGEMLQNWAAALKLPFVHLGLAQDFWANFGERYLEVEQGLPSTFFLIPFKDRPGKTANGSAPAMRAAPYQAKDLADTVKKLIAAGCEIGLHGIDAWIDAKNGREELNEIRQLTGAKEIGVRMHWLYNDQKSPSCLEAAGATYDSTSGYNGAIGYRAGTTQVFKPLDARELLELPLHVMDTSMFYPSHLGLSPQQAARVLQPIVENAALTGGMLTVNWHDRSIAPERLWEPTYRNLIDDMKARGAWFATAGQAIAWSKKRRSAMFEIDANEPGGMRARLGADAGDHFPGLRLRVHTPGKPGATAATPLFFDTIVGHQVAAKLPAETRS